jgi:hypothetical protein
MNPDQLKNYCIYTHETPDHSLECCSQISSDLNGFCQIHQQYVSSFQLLYPYYKKFVFTKIRSYITDNQKTESREIKAGVATQLFDFLCRHKYFVFTEQSMSNALLSKLLEFENDIDIFDINKYKKELFPFLFENSSEETSKVLEQEEDSDSLIINI